MPPSASITLSAPSQTLISPLVPAPLQSGLAEHIHHLEASTSPSADENAAEAAAETVAMAISKEMQTLQGVEGGNAGRQARSSLCAPASSGGPSRANVEQAGLFLCTHQRRFDPPPALTKVAVN